MVTSFCSSMRWRVTVLTVCGTSRGANGSFEPTVVGGLASLSRLAFTSMAGSVTALAGSAGFVVSCAIASAGSSKPANATGPSTRTLPFCCPRRRPVCPIVFIPKIPLHSLRGSHCANIIGVAARGAPAPVRPVVRAVAISCARIGRIDSSVSLNPCVSSQQPCK